MSESPRQGRYIGETFVAAYYLAIFFMAAQNSLLFLERHTWGILAQQREISSIVQGVVCLIVGIGILVQAKWAKVAAFILSFVIVTFILLWYVIVGFFDAWGSMPQALWQVIQPLAMVLSNAAIVIFFVHSWLRERRVIKNPTHSSIDGTAS